MLGRSLKTAALLMLMALIAAAQTIPAGTRLTVRVGSEISSETAKAGDRFDATLARPLVVNGKTLARTGAAVRGKVTSSKSSGRVHAPGELTLRLTGVQVNGRSLLQPMLIRPRARAIPRATPRKLAVAQQPGR
jgi:hypothetical protein